MKKVIELIRVSTERQAASDRASIPAQRTVNRRTCLQYGLEIVHSIEIADVSGASVLLAPEIQELMRLMQSPTVDGVVAREFSRLMRPENFADYALLQVFSDSKTVLYLPEGPIDLNNKTGRLMGTIRAAMAGMERTEILERIWSAKEEKRRRGELAQSSNVLPFGVGYEEGRGFYYEPKAELVREAFRQFLAGNQSYAQLAKMVGVTPRGMSIILRNPIWTGWRVIDKKRDLSGAGKYAGINGRQADRRKIDRAAEDVIRVQVIEKPLITQLEFETVQQIMDLKQQKHWRTQPDYDHRFTYNGFLTCSICGEIVHTALARNDYYACKGRRTDHTCRSKYMGRERLEVVLDGLFAHSLTSTPFLEGCVGELLQRTKQQDSVVETHRLTAELAMLRRKRERIIDGYIEGAIEGRERDRRLASIDDNIRLAQDRLNRISVITSVSMETLIEVFAHLAEWEFWTRDQKRQVLATLIPDIRVADYKIDSLGLNPSFFSNENTHTGTVALPFCHLELRAARRKPAKYPKQINSLGDHICARRLDLKLLQKQVADQIGVHEMTITGWESNATIPEVRYMPAIIQFLGYNPLPAASSLPERLVTARRAFGLSQRKMAEKLGVDPATLMGWEAGRHQPTEKSLDLIGRILQSW